MKKHLANQQALRAHVYIDREREGERGREGAKGVACATVWRRCSDKSHADKNQQNKHTHTHAHTLEIDEVVLSLHPQGYLQRLTLRVPLGFALLRVHRVRQVELEAAARGDDEKTKRELEKLLLLLLLLLTPLFQSAVNRLFKIVNV